MRRYRGDYPDRWRWSGWSARSAQDVGTMNWPVLHSGTVQLTTVICGVERKWGWYGKDYASKDVERHRTELRCWE